MPVFADMAILLTRFVSGRQCLAGRAVRQPGICQQDFRRLQRLRRDRRERMDPGRTHQQRLQPAVGHLSARRNRRGVEGGNFRVRRLLRPFHRNQRQPDDPQRRQRPARVSQLAILEQPLERREYVPDGRITTGRSMPPTAAATRPWRTNWLHYRFRQPASVRVWT